MTTSLSFGENSIVSQNGLSLHGDYSTSGISEELCRHNWCRQQSFPLVPLAAAGIMLWTSVSSPLSVTDEVITSYDRTATAAVSFKTADLITGRRISRAEALALCRKIREEAEREREEFAEWEASRGLPREIYA